ncbi:MAG: hypothetical protein MdMp024_1893 [Bacteroidales bacterium]
MLLEDRINTVIADALRSAVEQIKSNLAEQNINASGRTSAGIVYEKKDKIHEILSTDGAPVQSLERGQPPAEPPRNIVDILAQWSDDKGLNWGDEKQKRRIAGTVAYGKHKPRGWGRPAPSDYGNQSDTVYTPVLEQLIADLKEKLTVGIREELTIFMASFRNT